MPLANQEMKKGIAFARPFIAHGATVARLGNYVVKLNVTIQTLGVYHSIQLSVEC